MKKRNVRWLLAAIVVATSIGAGVAAAASTEAGTGAGADTTHAIATDQI